MFYLKVEETSKICIIAEVGLEFHAKMLVEALKTREGENLNKTYFYEETDLLPEKTGNVEIFREDFDPDSGDVIITTKIASIPQSDDEISHSRAMLLVESMDSLNTDPDVRYTYRKR